MEQSLQKEIRELQRTLEKERAIHKISRVRFNEQRKKFEKEHAELKNFQQQIENRCINLTQKLLEEKKIHQQLTSEIEKQKRELVSSTTTLDAYKAQYQQSLQNIIQKERDNFQNLLQKERKSHENKRRSLVAQNSILKMEKDAVTALCNQQKENIKGLFNQIDNVQAKYLVLEEQDQDLQNRYQRLLIQHQTQTREMNNHITTPIRSYEKCSRFDVVSQSSNKKKSIASQLSGSPLVQSEQKQTHSFCSEGMINNSNNNSLVDLEHYQLNITDNKVVDQQNMESILTNDLSHIHIKYAAQSQELEILRLQIANQETLKKDLEFYRQENIKLKNRLVGETKQREELGANLRLEKQVQSQYLAEINGLEEDLDKKENELEKTNNVLISKEKEIAEIKVIFQKKTLELNNISKDLKKTKSNLCKAKDKTEQLRSSQRDVDRQLRVTTSELHYAKKKIEQFDEMKKLYVESNTQVHELEEEILELQNSQEILEKEVTGLRTKFKEHNSKLQTRIHEYTNEKNKLQEKVRRVTQEFAQEQLRAKKEIMNLSMQLQQSKILCKKKC